jgi:general secretion pathway protein D
MTLILRHRFRVLLAVFGLLASFRLAAQDVTLNLKDADISALIDAVANITRKNFIVDPSVKGKVTVVSSTPMNDAEIFAVFQSILRVHGFAAIDDGKVVRVVPLDQARTDGSRTSEPGNVAGAEGEIITRVLAVRNVAASQLVPVLRPLVPESGHLAAAATTNAIVVTDRAVNVQRIAELVARIDGASDTQIDAVPLIHASAAEVVKVLGRLVDGNAVEGLSSSARISADERTNTILLRGDPEARKRLKAAVLGLDVPRTAGGNTHVITLRYSNAADLVPILEGVVQSVTPSAPDGTAAPSASGLKTTIMADEGSNALIITAPPDMLATLKEVASKLDHRRRQVLVEALIAEVSADKAAEIGVQWRATDSTSEDGAAFGGTNFNLSGNGINQTGANPLGVGDGLTLGFLEGTTNILGAQILNLGALIRLLSADTRTNILSTPSLVTLDNQEARIVVGQNVPFITGQFAATGAAQGAANPFQTIQRQDIGITLRVRPRVKQGNSVWLDIEQEVSSLSTNPTGTVAADLITNKRSIATSVLVDSTRIVVLGGLMQDDLQESRQKVPLVGDIPLLGKLFQYQRTEKTKQNLMVFLTPTILEDTEAHAQATRKPYQQLEDEQGSRAADGVRLMPKDSQPRLAPIWSQDEPAPRK